VTERARIRGRGDAKKGVTPAAFAKLALALPGAEAGTSHGVPVWRVKKKMFALYREKLASVGVNVDFDQREVLIQADPETFHFTDHYRNYEIVLVRLAEVRRAELAELLEQSWRRVAPSQLWDEL